jgi:hypothetical protein
MVVGHRGRTTSPFLTRGGRVVSSPTRDRIPQLAAHHFGERPSTPIGYALRTEGSEMILFSWRHYSTGTFACQLRDVALVSVAPCYPLGLILSMKEVT